jgi:hypothetical protein
MAAVLRLGVLLVLLAIAGCVAMSMLTGERRWLHYAWQVFKYALAIVGVVLAFLAIEQIVIAI